MYIGEKEIKSTKDTLDEIELVEVAFADGSVELFSKKMFEAIVTENACNLTELREKRVAPVVQEVLQGLRNWGIRLSELSYFSILLETSINENVKQAQNELWGEHMPKPNSPDEVSLITVDKVLKGVKVKLEDVLK